ALVIGNANIERIYDVVGATEDDATVVRRRASPIAGGYRVVEEEVSRSSTSPKNGMPLGGVEYHLQVDPAKGIATKVQMWSRQILVKAPLIAQSEPWTNTVQVARQGGTDKATETCKI